MKKSLKLRAVVSPTPTIIAAAYDENGKADACTLAFYTPTSHIPPCATIAINATAKRKTLKSILDSGAFTVGYPSIDQIAETDWLGIASGYEHDKITEVGWTVSRGEKVNAPVINEQITGEVVNILADEDILLPNGKYDLAKLKPIIYDEETRSYLSVGTKVSEAFKPGLVYRNEMKE